MIITKAKSNEKRDVPPTDQTKLFDQSCLFLFFSCIAGPSLSLCLLPYLLTYLAVSLPLSLYREITRMHSLRKKDTFSNPFLLKPPTKASLARSFFSRGGSGLAVCMSMSMP